METKYICYTDGGARGNPGPSGIGVVIQDHTGEILKEFSKFIGKQTNNFAEYEAVILLFSELTKLLGKKSIETEIEVRLDSELVTKQLRGEYRVKDAGLKKQYEKLEKIRGNNFPHVKFVHVRREKNKDADRLANVAMDRGR